MAEYDGLLSTQNLLANVFSCNAIRYVTLFWAFLTYCIIQCWRGKSFFKQKTLQQNKESFLIAQTAQLSNTVDKGFENQEQELTNQLPTESTQQITAQTNSLERNPLVLLTCKQNSYKDCVQKIRCRNLESLKRAQIRAYHKQKCCVEEDTLYEVGNMEMPEVDFTADYFAKLQSIQDNSQLS